MFLPKGLFKLREVVHDFLQVIFANTQHSHQCIGSHNGFVSARKQRFPPVNITNNQRLFVVQVPVQQLDCAAASSNEIDVFGDG